MASGTILWVPGSGRAASGVPLGKVKVCPLGMCSLGVEEDKSK